LGAVLDADATALATLRVNVRYVCHVNGADRAGLCAHPASCAPVFIDDSILLTSSGGLELTNAPPDAAQLLFEPVYFFFQFLQLLLESRPGTFTLHVEGAPSLVRISFLHSNSACWQPVTFGCPVAITLMQAQPILRSENPSAYLHKHAQ